MFTHFLFFHWV